MYVLSSWVPPPHPRPKTTRPHDLTWHSPLTSDPPHDLITRWLQRCSRDDVALGLYADKRMELVRTKKENPLLPSLRNRFPMATQNVGNNVRNNRNPPPLSLLKSDVNYSFTGILISRCVA